MYAHFGYPVTQPISSYTWALVNKMYENTKEGSMQLFPANLSFNINCYWTHKMGKNRRHLFLSTSQ